MTLQDPRPARARARQMDAALAAGLSQRSTRERREGLDFPGHGAGQRRHRAEHGQF